MQKATRSASYDLKPPDHPIPQANHPPRHEGSEIACVSESLDTDLLETFCFEMASNPIHSTRAFSHADCARDRGGAWG